METKEKRKKKKVRRECLRCGRMFMSEGIYNRICPSCREINSNIAWQAVTIDLHHFVL